MKVLQFSCYSSWGGAPRVAYGLHSYINNNTNSTGHMFCRTKTDNDENVKQFYRGTLGRIHRVAIDRFESLIGLQYFFQKSFNSIASNEWFKSADIVHFHNTHGGYLNQWFLPEVAKRKPVVWTFHDMWPITGRCAHGFDCERWKIGCGRCPYKTAYPPSFIDTSSFLWKLKKTIYANININIVCPSFWLYNKLHDSFLSHCNASVIKNAVDVSIFKPYNKSRVRESLGIPNDRFILLFVAHHGLSSVFKGFDYLVESLITSYKRGLKPFLIIIGNKKDVDFCKIGLRGKCLGTISDERLMAKYYSSASALIVPSTAENVPLVVIESLACGTPVIAFKLGGIPEMIDHKRTGYLANPRTVKELTEGVQWLMRLENNEYNTISQWCRETALREYSLENQVKKYMDLYSSIIK